MVPKGATPPTKARHGELLGVSARLDPELYHLLRESRDARDELRYVLIDRWFPEKRTEVEVLDRAFWSFAGARRGGTLNVSEALAGAPSGEVRR